MNLSLAIIVCIGLYTASADPPENELDEEFQKFLEKVKKYSPVADSILILRIMTWCNSEHANVVFKTKCIEAFRKKRAPGAQTLNPFRTWEYQAAYETLTEQITMLSFGDDGTPELERANTDYSEVSICSICSHHLSATGEHFIVATKCGHIFGDSCLRQLLSRFADNSGECPICSEKLGLDDFCRVYDKNVVVFDQEKHNELQNRLEALNHEKDMLKTLGITYCECKSCNLSFKSEADLNKHRTKDRQRNNQCCYL